MNEAFPVNDFYLIEAAYDASIRQQISSFIGKPTSLEEIPWLKQKLGFGSKNMTNIRGNDTDSKSNALGGFG